MYFGTAADPIPLSSIGRIADFNPTPWIIQVPSEPRYNGAVCANMARKGTMTVELCTMQVAIRRRGNVVMKYRC